MTCSERITRVLLMLADEQREVPIMENGNIAVAVGMKNVSFENGLFTHGEYSTYLQCIV